MLNGTTYIVRPCMAPANFSLSSSPISPGSERARYEFGRLASESFSNVPASTSSEQRASYSSADPSHQWMRLGWASAAISSTQARSLACLVGTDVSMATGGIDLSQVCQIRTNNGGTGRWFWAPEASTRQ